jgi:hypothetical protein
MSFWMREMEFHVDKNTSCYCLSTIKSAINGGYLLQAERMPFHLWIVCGTDNRSLSNPMQS